MSTDAYQPRRCCACGKVKTTVRNIAFLQQKAPGPGTGWGCVVCHLPSDGAIALACDERSDDPNVELQWAIAGTMDSPERVPIAELKGKHEHNPRFHPELAERN
jgi:hypothetical protein